MPHDIRTPMNAIIGYSQLAKKEMNDISKVSQYLDNILLCGQKMLSIIDNILEITRIENDKVQIEYTIKDIEQIFDVCLMMEKPDIEENALDIQVNKEIIYPYVYVDEVHLLEIILNLLRNSIKYTNQGGKIIYSLKQEMLENECINIITICDNGRGMSEEFQKHIFDSFSRERSSSDSGIEGTGLGMGIAKKLTDLMNGTIKVESQLGKGTRFTVKIPSKIAQKEDILYQSSLEPIENKNLNNKKILLVEDNDFNAEIIIELLKEKGLYLERVANGIECLDILKEKDYDLILMDIQMPLMNGYDTTIAIRKLTDQQKAQIPIIALTANAFAEDRQKSLAVGMNDFIAKPIDLQILLPLLAKYL